LTPKDTNCGYPGATAQINKVEKMAVFKSRRRAGLKGNGAFKSSSYLRFL